MSYSNLAVFYDRLQIADYNEIGAFYHRLLKKNSADSKSRILLDLACGTGSLSRYFAELGYDVIGADISPEMLSEAMKKPHRGIQYLCQDMTKLDLFGTIDCCICALDAVNHLPGIEALREAFSRVSLFMNKGGMFVFDVNTLYKHTKILSGNTFVIESENLFCAWQNSLCEEGKVEITLDVFADDGKTWKRYTENILETAYSLTEITKMLKKTGFGNIKIYDWLSDKPAGKLSEKAVFTAIKM
ncbi:MAG: class I SAM-dependent methyltransferase [Oscillospiraceae bacterium]|jgi:ubiquinone/menaquinone biosynthesis C-methylase UbiE|nr:class I SAM-dependent methyltransferase [Oscillospiraceae bacterium]